MRAHQSCEQSVWVESYNRSPMNKDSRLNKTNKQGDFTYIALHSKTHLKEILLPAAMKAYYLHLAGVQQKDEFMCTPDTYCTKI